MRKMLNNAFTFWFIEIVLMSIYKYIYEFIGMKYYMNVYGYLYSNVTYIFNFDKWIFSNILLLLFFTLLLQTPNNRNAMYNWFIRFSYMICIIPMLSVYAFFSSIGFIDVLCPSIFWFIMICMLRYYAKQGADPNPRVLFSLPKILHVDLLILLFCAVAALLIWAIAGFPVVLSLDATTEQRMSLRAAALPSLLNYIFMFLGGTIFPYLVAKYIDRKKYILALISFLLGILMFFVNGMKSWLLLYLLIIVIAVICKMSNGEDRKLCILIEVAMLCLFCVLCFYSQLVNNMELLGMFNRMTLIPCNIGFKSIRFFRNNELLYLRESILRNLFSTPYPGGSDFYINYGVNSTLTSSRANNGLWGDAFRNFGLVGIVIYPLIIAKVFNIVERNSRTQNTSFRLFVLFMMLWSSINTSFFTWLLTGGVIIVVLLEKIDVANEKYLRMKIENDATVGED